MADRAADPSLFDHADPPRVEPDGFAFRPARGSVDVSRSTRLLARMGFVIVLLAVIVAVALYGVGLIVKVQLDRVFLG